MAEFYFDMETTGFDFDTDTIETIQWQRLNGFVDVNQLVYVEKRKRCYDLVLMIMYPVSIEGV